MGLKTLKYLKHLVLFAKYSLIRTASFKVDFWLRFLVDFFYYLSSVIVIFTIYENVSSIRGWTREEYFLILSIFFLIDSYQMVFVSPNAWNVNYLINSGKLDYFLLKPVSSFFLVFFNTVEVSSILNFL
ncbi:MAG: ABC-2 family transporter protein, partial [Deltaproteobacteria bacterium]|nr:ABC-2 family transporter protein [Deltaproteobacteria bacterium]